jgi:hypothetical protein
MNGGTILPNASTVLTLVQGATRGSDESRFSGYPSLEQLIVDRGHVAL